MKVRIEITKGPDAGRNFVMGPNEKITIGRGDNVQIQMLDGLISREHCEVIFDGKHVIIRDLKSTNHTFVQQNLTEPITPNQPYEIPNGTSFFVGPESRFSVTFEQEGLKTRKPHESSGPGNFTPSIKVQDSSADWSGDSSIHNLIGPVSLSPGLDDLGQKGRPHSPAQPHNPPPTREQPPLDSPRYDTNSIAPPHLQGGGGQREQITDAIENNDSELKRTPQTRSPESPPPVRAPKPDPPVSSSSFEESVIHESVSGHLDSIALPGGIYPDRPQSAKPVPSNPFEASVVPDSLAGHPQTADSSQPADVPQAADTLPPEEPASRAQPNGLYYHTGDDPGSISQVIAELGKKLTPLFCIDLSRIDQSPVEPPPLEDAKPAIPNPPPTAETPPSKSPRHDSVFELDDEDEPSEPPPTPTSPPESNPNPNPNPPAEPAAIVGVPLFDYLPPELQNQGPVLMTTDQFNISIDEAWQHDALVVFFGEDVEQMFSHLKKLLRTNILSGKEIDSLFGFCWPSVLHSTFDGMGKKPVSRIFGDSISCILLEDPQQRFVWNLVAQNDLNDDLVSLI